MQTLLDLRNQAFTGTLYSAQSVTAFEFAAVSESTANREIFRKITGVPITPSTAVSAIPRVRPFLSGAQVVFLWIHLHPLDLIQKAADVPNFSFTAPYLAPLHLKLVSYRVESRLAVVQSEIRIEPSLHYVPKRIQHLKRLIYHGNVFAVLSNLRRFNVPEQCPRLCQVFDLARVKSHDAAASSVHRYWIDAED